MNAKDVAEMLMKKSDDEGPSAWPSECRHLTLLAEAKACYEGSGVDFDGGLLRDGTLNLHMELEGIEYVIDIVIRRPKVNQVILLADSDGWMVLYRMAELAVMSYLLRRSGSRFEPIICHVAIGATGTTLHEQDVSAQLQRHWPDDEIGEAIEILKSR